MSSGKSAASSRLTGADAALLSYKTNPPTKPLSRSTFEGKENSSPIKSASPTEGAVDALSASEDSLKRKSLLGDELSDLGKMQQFVSNQWDQLSTRGREITAEQEAVAKAERALQERRVTLKKLDEELRARERAVQSKEARVVYSEEAARLREKLDQTDVELAVREKQQQCRQRELDEQEADLRSRTLKLESTGLEVAELEQWTSKREREVRSRKELLEKAKKAEELERRVDELQARLSGSASGSPGSLRASVQSVGVQADLASPSDPQQQQQVGLLWEQLQAERQRTAELTEMAQQLEAKLEKQKNRAEGGAAVRRGANCGGGGRAGSAAAQGAGPSAAREGAQPAAGRAGGPGEGAAALPGSRREEPPSGPGKHPGPSLRCEGAQ
eukprot:RCo007889